MQTSTFPRKLLITATITSDFYEANDKFPHLPLWLCYKDQKIKKKKKQKNNWTEQKVFLHINMKTGLSFFQLTFDWTLLQSNLYYLDFVNPHFSIIKTCSSSPIFNEYK